MTDARCVGCGGQLGIRLPVVVDPESGDTFSILACDGCGLGHTLPVPSSLRHYYGPSYHGGRHGWTSRLCTLRRYGLLCQHTVEPGYLLDLGCGDAAFLRECAAHGWRVAGTEREEVLRSNDALAIDVRADITDFAEGSSFTAATAWHSLEHVADPLGDLRKLRARMATGGKLFVAVPNNGSLQALAFGRRWLHLDVPRHLHHFDERSLSHMLDRAGFRVVQLGSGEIEYDVFGWVQSALDSAIPTPRVLYRTLTGRPPQAGPATVAASAILGLSLGIPAIALTRVERWRRRSGTLVVVAVCA